MKLQDSRLGTVRLPQRLGFELSVIGEVGCIIARSFGGCKYFSKKVRWIFALYYFQNINTSHKTNTFSTPKIGMPLLYCSPCTNKEIK
jgi:hypothetical protein